LQTESPPVTRMDTLRLNDAQARAVTRRLDQASRSFRGREQRAHPRKTVDNASRLIARIRPQRDSTALEYVVRCRNISRGGASLLHGSYVHPQTPCDLLIEQQDAPLRTMSARVATCRHIERHVHELGVQFNQLAQTPMVQQDDEAIDTPVSSATTPLVGDVLYADPRCVERQAIALWLRRMGLDVDKVDSAAALLRHMEQAAYQLVMMTDALPDMSGVDVIRLFRQQDRHTPTVLMLHELDETHVCAALDAGCTHVMTATPRLTELRRAMGWLLPADEPSEGLPSVLMSDHWHDAAMRPIIRAYVDQIQAKLRRLAHQAHDRNHASRPEVIGRLIDSASMMGYPRLAAEARRWAESLDDPNEAGASLRNLRALVRAARAGIDQSDT